MKKIILLSDTHAHLDSRILPYLESINEIWHAGDVGDTNILETLKKYATVRVVHGNIDDHKVRYVAPEWLEWKTESVSVLMTHIGGRPPKFAPAVKERIRLQKPNIFICGHSHILLVQYVPELNCLHLNPGACGKSGWHTIQTLLRFNINEDKVSDLQVIELRRNPSA